jgi:hypothetical protein
VAGASTGNGTGSDYIVIKYDTGGSQLWEVRHNGSGNGDDGASDITLDADGFVYTTGRIFYADSGLDYTTMKHDTDGNLLWEVRYNGPANSADLATQMTVGADGSVYVTGWSFNLGTSYDYATVKYVHSSSLQLQIGRWAR